MGLKIDKDYVGVVSLGIMVYFQFFALLASNSYWTYFYSLQFTTIASSIFNIFETIGAIVSIPLMNKLSIYVIVNITFCINLFSMVSIPFFVFIENSLVKTILTVLPIACMGIAGGSCFTTLATYSSQINQIYPQALWLGCGISEVIVQLLKICFMYIGTIFGGTFENQLYLQNVVYFMICICYLVAIACVWQKMAKKHSFCKKTISQEQHKEQDLDDCNNSQESQIEQELLISEETIYKQKNKNFSLKTINLGIAMFLTQFVTYLMFPALTTSIPFFTNFSNNLPFIDQYFSLWMMTAYLFSDFLGRMLIKFKLFQKYYNYIVCVVIAYFRVLLVPVFFLVNLPRPQQPDILPFIHNDVFSYFLVIIFSITGGMNLTAIFIRIQDGVVDNKETHKISNFVSVMCSMGCTFSGFIAIPVSILIQDK